MLYLISIFDIIIQYFFVYYKVEKGPELFFYILYETTYLLDALVESPEFIPSNHYFKRDRFFSFLFLFFFLAIMKVKCMMGIYLFLLPPERKRFI